MPDVIPTDTNVGGRPTDTNDPNYMGNEDSDQQGGGKRQRVDENLPGGMEFEDDEVYDMTLPPLVTTEDSFTPCERADAERMKDCDNLRKRVAEWLKNQGCPSVIRKYKKPARKSCCAKARKPCKKRTSCGCGY